MSFVRVQNLSKTFVRYPSQGARLKDWLFPFLSSSAKKTPILKSINFSIGAGEAVGIIGLNGAGKSTLLKIITGTLQPTTGNVTLSGKVVALLELGMGFHPDFTGRQNLHTGGVLLGLSKEQINSITPQILDFAEIGAYIDEPVRTYSSGMQMRLAFSLATAMRPDVLIVDEALSVGDAYFQHKSFERIREFSNLGTTLLIVSHDKQAILSICNRAILLNAGSIAMEGDPESVMDFYNAQLSQQQNQRLVQIKREDGRTQTSSGTGEATVEMLELRDLQNNATDSVRVGETVKLFARVKVTSRLPKLVFGYAIKDRLGQVMYGTNTALTQQIVESCRPGDLVEFSAEFAANLGVGSYSIQTALVSSETHLKNNYEWRDLALIFTVVNPDRPYFAGCNWLAPNIKIQKR
jgi:lipopolysaccharide transport system ATP-binding protein